MREHFTGYADLNNQEPLTLLFRSLKTNQGFEREAAIAWLAALYCIKRNAQFVVKTVNQTTSFISFSDETLQKHPVLFALSKAFSDKLSNVSYAGGTGVPDSRLRAQARK